MNIVFLDSTAIPKHIPIPRPSFPHNWVEYEYTSADQTIERAKDADIIITSKVILSREVLQQLPKLKLIAITATGTNNVDLEAAKELGVAVKNIFKNTNYPLNEVIKMATYNGAKHCKVDDKKGLIKEGYDADLILFDDNIDIKYVIVNGKLVHKA